MRNIKIVTDSSSDVLSLEGVAFESAPLKIVLDGKSYTDDATLDVEEMANTLVAYKGRSTTSCPNPEDYLRAFGDADEVYCTTITGSLSGSYNSAVLAKATYEAEHPDRRVYVLNSLSTGPEMSLIIDRMRTLILEGRTFEEITAGVEEYCRHTGLLFVLESMRNLANNGRVSPVVAKVAGMLGIRVIGRASEKGDLEMLSKPRGEKNTLAGIIEQLRANGYSGGAIKIAHCVNEPFANSLATLVASEFGAKDISIYQLRGLCSFYAERGGLIIGFEKA